MTASQKRVAILTALSLLLLAVLLIVAGTGAGRSGNVDPPDTGYPPGAYAACSAFYREVNRTDEQMAGEIQHAVIDIADAAQDTEVEDEAAAMLDVVMFAGSSDEEAVAAVGAMDAACGGEE